MKRKQKNFGVATPTSGHANIRTEYLETTLGLVNRLEISKELIHECVTVPGCCCCIPLLFNHLMDLCNYLRKNALLAAKGGCTCTPLTPSPKSATDLLPLSVSCSVYIHVAFQEQETDNTVGKPIYLCMTMPTDL